MTSPIELDKLKTLAHRAARSAQAQFGALNLTDHDY